MGGVAAAGVYAYQGADPVLKSKNKRNRGSEMLILSLGTTPLVVILAIRNRRKRTRERERERERETTKKDATPCNLHDRHQKTPSYLCCFVWPRSPSGTGLKMKIFRL